MRLLKRNLTEFEYLKLEGSTDLNEDEEHTGEYRNEYAEPVKYRGNISTPNGQINQMFYGTDTRYTHILLMDNPKVKFEETGLIRWKDDLYDITAIRYSMNVLNVALRKRTSYTETDNP